MFQKKEIFNYRIYAYRFLKRYQNDHSSNLHIYEVHIIIEFQSVPREIRFKYVPGYFDLLPMAADTALKRENGHLH